MMQGAVVALLCAALLGLNDTGRDLVKALLCAAEQHHVRPSVHHITSTSLGRLLVAVLLASRLRIAHCSPWDLHGSLPSPLGAVAPLRCEFSTGWDHNNSDKIQIYDTGLCHITADAIAPNLWIHQNVHSGNALNAGICLNSTGNVMNISTAVADNPTELTAFKNDTETALITAITAIVMLSAIVPCLAASAAIGVFLFGDFHYIRQHVAKQMRDRRRFDRAAKMSTRPLPRGYPRSIVKLRDRANIEEFKSLIKDRVTPPPPKQHDAADGRVKIPEDASETPLIHQPLTQSTPMVDFYSPPQEPTLVPQEPTLVDRYRLPPATTAEDANKQRIKIAKIARAKGAAAAKENVNRAHWTKVRKANAANKAAAAAPVKAAAPAKAAVDDHVAAVPPTAWTSRLSSQAGLKSNHQIFASAVVVCRNGICWIIVNALECSCWVVVCGTATAGATMASTLVLTPEQAMHLLYYISMQQLPWPGRTTYEATHRTENTNKTKGNDRRSSASAGWRFRPRYLNGILVCLAMFTQFAGICAEENHEPTGSCTLPVVEDWLAEGGDVCAARSAWIVALVYMCVHMVFLYCNRGRYDDLGELRKDHLGRTEDFSCFAWTLVLAVSIVIVWALIWLGVKTCVLEVLNLPVYLFLLGLGAVFVGFMHRSEGKSFDTNGAERVPIYKDWTAKALDQINSAVTITMLLNGVSAVILVCRGDHSAAFALVHLLPLTQLLLAIVWMPIVRSLEGPKEMLKTMGVSFLVVLPMVVDLFQYALLHWPKMNWGTKTEGVQSGQSARVIKKRLRLQRNSMRMTILNEFANSAVFLCLCVLAMANVPVREDNEYDKPANVTAAEVALKITAWTVFAPLGITLCLAVIAWLRYACSPICTKCADSQENQIVNNLGMHHDCSVSTKSSNRRDLIAGRREGEVFLHSDSALGGDKLHALRKAQEAKTHKLAESTVELQLEPEHATQAPPGGPKTSPPTAKTGSDYDSADELLVGKDPEANVDGDLEPPVSNSTSSEWATENVPGSGACLFHAVGMTHDPGEAQVLRHRVVDWATENWRRNPDIADIMGEERRAIQGTIPLQDEFKRVNGDTSVDDAAQYQQLMLRDDTYGEVAEAAVAAWLLGVDLDIWSLDNDGNIHKELSGLGAAGGEKRSILRTGEGWGAHYQILRNPTGYLQEDSADELPRSTEEKDPREEETGSDYGSAEQPPVIDLEADLGGDLPTYADDHPLDGDADCQAYFSKLSIPDAFDQILAFVVTVYSEAADELHKTLSSLVNIAAIRGVYIKVLLVFDGVFKYYEKTKEYVSIVKECTRNYLAKMFPALGDWSRFCPEEGDLQQTTVVPAALAIGDCDMVRGLENRRDMDVDVLIKQSNLQKANSIEWGLRFGHEIGCKWIYFTDVGTMYHKDCLWHLVEHLQRNPHTAGCTGTQRAMPVSLDWQKTNSDGKPYVDTTDSGPWGYLLRMLQVFEVEAQNVVSRAISSASGFMHVLSGPGALYRFDVLYAVRKEIFGFLYKPEAECSGVDKNLQRGEDRAFSIMVVFSQLAKLLDDTFRTHWVPKAIHYWSVETTPRVLIGQRERWINAAVAFHEWMLERWELITGSHHSLAMRVWALLLLILGYIGLVTLALGPGITGGLVWTLTYHILAAEPSDVASSGSGLVLDTVDELECQICEAIPGSVATDAWCMADCGDSIVRHPDICRCI